MNSTDIDFYSYFAYLGPFWFVGLLSRQTDKTLRFHINQGLVLFLGEIIAALAAYISGLLLELIPVCGRWLSFGVRILVIVVSCLLSVYGMSSVARRIMRPLPLIGKIRLIR